MFYEILEMKKKLIKMSLKLKEKKKVNEEMITMSKEKHEKKIKLTKEIANFERCISF